MKFRATVNGTPVTLIVHTDEELPHERQYGTAFRIATRLQADGEVQLVRQKPRPIVIPIRELADKADMFVSRKFKDVLKALVRAATSPEEGRKLIEMDEQAYLAEQSANMFEWCLSVVLDCIEIEKEGVGKRLIQRSKTYDGLTPAQKHIAEQFMGKLNELRALCRGLKE